MFTSTIKSEWNEDICILIQVQNHSYNYICECGEAKALSVKECMDTNAIFISHTHIDHFVNFDTILRHQIGIGRKVTICGPKGIINQIQHRIKSYQWNLISENAVTYEVREILTETSYKKAILKPPYWEKEAEATVNSEVIFTEKDFNVFTTILDHKTASVAYLFKGNDKIKIKLPKDLKGGKWVNDLKLAYQNNAPETIINITSNTFKAKDLFKHIYIEKGKSIGVIMDHAATKDNHEKIRATFLGCDDLFIESSYKDEDKEFAVKNHHSYASKSGEIAAKCQIKVATPVHFSRKYNEEEVTQVKEQFYEALKKG